MAIGEATLFSTHKMDYQLRPVDGAWKPTAMIQLRGVRVHNLKNLDIDLPTHKLIVVCGVSGSGKTSLALDTLYAEGQRRYIESFSAYTRQFLERLEKPDADRIDGLPPAIAVKTTAVGNRRSTVATLTEVSDYIRLLLARVGEIRCLHCQQPVQSESPQSVGGFLQTEIADNQRWLIAFDVAGHSSEMPVSETLQEIQQRGFVRGIVEGRMVRFDELNLNDTPIETALAVVDRFKGVRDIQRIRDSLETAFANSPGSCTVLIDRGESGSESDTGRSHHCSSATLERIDGAEWHRFDFSSNLACRRCGVEYWEPSPQLFSFNHSLGACPTCEGFGNVLEIDMERVVPDPSKSIRDGAIAPWTTPAYKHEWQELMALAADEGIDVDVPYNALPKSSRQLIQQGVPAHDFGGLRGFFAWLERRKYKMQHRVFLSRWKGESCCPACDGQRLRPESLAVRVDGKNYAEICRMQVSDAISFFRQGLDLTREQTAIAGVMLEQIIARLGYLKSSGLDYLTLDRPMQSMSGGEARRVALTKALGSSLVNLLYVLDEPSAGLHPHDVQRLTSVLTDIRDRGNTVLVVEHEEAILLAADHLVEIGPGAGSDGGRLIYSGDCEGMLASKDSLTGAYLSGRLLGGIPEHHRPINRGKIKLLGACGNNLKNVDVEFPLGVLCLVTGVSGSGKTSLVQKTLYGALCRRLRKDCNKPLPYRDVYGDGQIDDVVLIDQSPVAKTPRSNPVTYTKAFDAIRKLFAETIEARTRNFGVGHFSFNAEKGRCEECQGDGSLEIDMQFLADIRVPCPRCRGTRYRKEILNIRYRSCSIADVLNMTVRESIGFFRGQKKIQAKLQPLLNVGLGYLALGQPATTLSRGEAQRLKLSAFLGKATRSRTLFLLDEPTSGLHFSDVVKLIDCFDALLNVGHSLIVVEHNIQLMMAADHIIDLGPGPAADGGAVVTCGTPEEVAACSRSLTGKFLRARPTVRD
jgi:excinuclease ABC subunit A